MQSPDIGLSADLDFKLRALFGSRHMRVLARQARLGHPGPKGLSLLLTAGFGWTASTIVGETFKLMLKSFGINDLAKALAAA